MARPYPAGIGWFKNCESGRLGTYRLPSDLPLHFGLMANGMHAVPPCREAPNITLQKSRSGVNSKKRACSLLPHTLSIAFKQDQSGNDGHPVLVAPPDSHSPCSRFVERNQKGNYFRENPVFGEKHPVSSIG